jgi:hypothetical protein
MFVGISDMGDSDPTSDPAMPKPSLPILDYETPEPSDSRLIFILQQLVSGIAIICILFALVAGLVGAFVGGMIYVISKAASDKTLAVRLRVFSVLATIACVLGIFIIIAVVGIVGDFDFILHPSFFGSFGPEYAAVRIGLYLFLSGILLFASIRSYAWIARKNKP